MQLFDNKNQISTQTYPQIYHPNTLAPRTYLQNQSPKKYSADYITQQPRRHHESTLAESRHAHKKSIDIVRPALYYQPDNNRFLKKPLSNEKNHGQDSEDEKFILRNTISMTNLVKLNDQINLGLQNISFTRKSFMPRQKIKEKPEFVNLESTLTNLEKKISHAKKQLEKKKQLRIKQEEFRHGLFFEEDKDQESLISQTQSTNTVKKPNILRISSLVTRMPRPKQARPFEFNPYSPRRHNVYYVSEVVRAIHQKNSLAREHIVSSIKILKYLENEQFPSYAQVQERKLNLRKKDMYKDKKTLVFDLDETLIHCIENCETECDVRLKIVFGPGEELLAGINIRPYALSMLRELSKNFELIIFTASHSSYANVVLDYLDPEKKLFQHRLYREHCYFSRSGLYIKDLRIINRGLNEMVLIDNAAYSYAFQLENGVPILPYYEGSNDFELKELKGYLDRLANMKDVREINKKTFKLHQYRNFDKSEELIQSLYMS